MEADFIVLLANANVDKAIRNNVLPKPLGECRCRLKRSTRKSKRK